ncbi:immunity protein Imm33 domain-containing protein [Capnocytophaga catalasegens]|uniref:Imm33-like domain-containing protein n=1 Tax=Capnocytophaga catalasegens TaxID=1004260 RepID=A0AAV5ASV9_9FLAO|nr:hypothetical protein [Capnocytophaga catalasegens]GIZ16014.1 hypothetical protein RCZ03_20140 [Capnocytophaga catalasegens]GJM50429.1 hypothetical protein RCZ15_14020 [Capnocytophaga catalasegens]GJM51817.1 hypothetical protein RCZ16_01350 [Capnocytophaga catalasegens]
MEEIQKEICQKYNSLYCPIQVEDSVIIVGKNLTILPIFGCKIIDWDNAGKEVEYWYISVGETDENSPEKIISVQTLQEILPKVVPYLGLAIGFNFIIDEENGVDIWFED